MSDQFSAAVQLFERDKGWHYVAVPSAISKPYEHLADRGLIAVTATIGQSSWPTSLLPMGDGTHFIALPAKIRSKEKLALGAEVIVAFALRTRSEGANRPMRNERVYKMAFSSVYPLLVQKAEKKGRTKQEVDAVICWLTGYDERRLRLQIEKATDYETFFGEAPQMNPNAGKITGVVCGIRVETIDDPLMQKVRWLDKLVDELAKGKPIEKILRN